MTYSYPVPYTRSVGRPKVKSVRWNARLSEDVYLLLVALSDKLDRDKTQVAEDAIRTYAKAHDVTPADPSRLPSASSSKEPPAAVHETRGDKSG